MDDQGRALSANTELPEELPQMERRFLAVSIPTFLLDDVKLSLTLTDYPINNYSCKCLHSCTELGVVIQYLSTRRFPKGYW